AGGRAGGSATGGGMGGGGGSTVYPAPHGPYPRVLSQGGPVLANPKFYSINFSNQTASFTTSYDDMVNTVGGTAYWTAATSEYGVHAGTAAPPIHLMETAPTSITDQGIDTWLKGKLDGTHPEFGTPNSNSLYIIFYPQG